MTAATLGVLRHNIQQANQQHGSASTSAERPVAPEPGVGVLIHGRGAHDRPRERPVVLQARP
jgi:hypothetical protein